MTLYKKLGYGCLFICFSLLLLFTLKECGNDVKHVQKQDELILLNSQYKQNIAQKQYIIDSLAYNRNLVQKENEQLKKKYEVAIKELEELKKESKQKLLAVKNAPIDSHAQIVSTFINDSVNVDSTTASFKKENLWELAVAIVENELLTKENIALNNALYACDTTLESTYLELAFYEEENKQLREQTVLNAQLYENTFKLYNQEKKQNKKQKVLRIVENIVYPSLAGAAGFALGYFIPKIPR